ncbi:MAG: alpha-galactosidase [Holophagaceae bacterium]|nr:alpha-galactosidase [Holophagaceae bacterium]
MTGNNPIHQAGIIKSLLKFFSVAVFVITLSHCAKEGPPPNAPAAIGGNLESGSIKLKYHNRTIASFSVAIEENGKNRKPRKGEVEFSHTSFATDLVEQRITFILNSSDANAQLVVTGKVFGSVESFPAETLGEAQKTFSIVRNSVGISRNLRNNAIYDRKWDWVIEAVAHDRTAIEPVSESDGGNTFNMESHGSAIELAFRPHYYRAYKNLKYFEPWKQPVRKDSISGWCSWWAYRTSFAQKDLDEILDVFSEKKLGDFGYKWIQIDDTFQGGSGTPESWIKWNDKFPDGMKGYADRVRAAGFEPAIWIGAFFRDNETLEKHPEWFVQNTNGELVRGPWLFYGIDATVPEAAKNLVYPTYRAFSDAGFTYVKIDTLRHLLYDGINVSGGHGSERGFSADDVFRAYLKTARQGLGKDPFLLACWGVLPEAIGFADGCRLGGDGFGPATMQQYNSWNGVVWRNDPDHCDILPRERGMGVGNVLQTAKTQAYLTDTVLRPTLASISGSMLMISDRPEVYRDDANLEGIKRAAPVLFTVPGQLYDFDPRKSDNVIKLDRADVKQGGPPSPIDADQEGEVCPWWLLEVNKPFERWNVLGRMNWTDSEFGSETVRFSDLGLDPDKDYLVFEFWTKQFLGVSSKEYVAPKLGVKGTQLFSIREFAGHPQIASTSRHISQGGHDLESAVWDGRKNILKARSLVVAGDSYEITVFVPEGYVLESSSPSGAVAEGQLVKLKIDPKQTGSIDWEVKFKLGIGSI